MSKNINSSFPSVACMDRWIGSSLALFKSVMTSNQTHLKEQTSMKTISKLSSFIEWIVLKFIVCNSAPPFRPEERWVHSHGIDLVCR